MHLYAIYVKIINYIHVYKFYFTMCYCIHKIYRFCYKFILFLHTYKYKYIHILVQLQVHELILIFLKRKVLNKIILNKF